jgi:hypothetical protein
LRRAAPQLSARARQFSITNIEGLLLGNEVPSGQFPLRAKTAMLAD